MADALIEAGYGTMVEKQIKTKNKIAVLDYTV